MFVRGAGGIGSFAGTAAVTTTKADGTRALSLVSGSTRTPTTCRLGSMDNQEIEAAVVRELIRESHRQGQISGLSLARASLPQAIENAGTPFEEDLKMGWNQYRIKMDDVISKEIRKLSDV